MFEAHIQTLQHRIKQVLDPLISQGASVALLDYPYHSNVGDSLIWLGEVEYLQYRKCNVCYVSYIGMRPPLGQHKVLEAVDIILLHGGGNFGTIWPAFQAFREAVIQDFPHKRIIQLPQSVFFDNEADRLRSFEHLARHKNLTILVRDAVSLQLLSSSHGLDVALCPDMAFMLGSVVGLKKNNTKRAVFLSRSDKEKLHTYTDFQQDAAWAAENLLTLDWLEESLLERVLIKVERNVSRFLGRWLAGKKVCFLLLNAIARARKIRGVHILSRGDVVMTDRLHAHILSVLMGRPHVILDNNNNKLGAFYETWMQGLPHIRFMSEEVIASSRISQAITHVTYS